MELILQIYSFKTSPQPSNCALSTHYENKNDEQTTHAVEMRNTDTNRYPNQQQKQYIVGSDISPELTIKIKIFHFYSPLYPSEHRKTPNRCSFPLCTTHTIQYIFSNVI